MLGASRKVEDAMSATNTAIVTLSHVPCCECGITFGIPLTFEQERRSDQKSFWCPNGHILAYSGKSEASRLRGELDYEKQLRAKWRRYYERAQSDYQQERRTSAAYRGQITKMKKRAKAGVCPCCKRTFKQLASHMKTQHPDWAAEEK